MATSLTAPQVLKFPFANGTSPSSVPVDPTGTNAASLTEGIPPVCSTPLGTGGLPVRRADFNNLGYLATSLNYFLQNGGSFTYDAAVATAIGGYPAGAILRYTDGNGNVSIVRSVINNNSYNFVTDPTKIDGAKWEIVIGEKSIRQIKTYSRYDVFHANPAVIPADNTVPQNTEGYEALVCAITPLYPDSILKIDVSVNFATDGTYHITSLFRDSIANAIATDYNIGFVDLPSTLTMTKIISAGSISETTFKVRIGTETGNLVLNGVYGSPWNLSLFGGTVGSSITITELAP